MSARSGISSPAAFRVRLDPIQLPQGVINGMNQLSFSLGRARDQPLDEFPMEVQNYIDDIERLVSGMKSFSEKHGSNRSVREIMSQLDTHRTIVRFSRELPSKDQNIVQRIQRLWQPQNFTTAVLVYIQAVDKLMDDTVRVFGQQGANHYVGEEIMSHLQHLQDEALDHKVIPYQAYRGQRRPDQGYQAQRRPDQRHPKQG
jgi:hypothetical protein